MTDDVRLSICIATFRRAAFLPATLDSIVGQLVPGVEVVVVDGASPDETPEVLARYTARHPAIRYHREPTNSGVDRDFDKAVQYARGRHCWLMTDDDILASDAVRRVLEKLDGDPDLVVANARVMNLDLSRTIYERQVKIDADRSFGRDENEALFELAGSYLSFIGAVVVRRALWLEREREKYMGSLFIHVGVLFQAPLSAVVIADPLIFIRYGNAMWTHRQFEIWCFLWPRLVWSFPQFSDRAKRAVAQADPWRDRWRLFVFRACGAYGPEAYDRLLRANVDGRDAVVPRLIAAWPRWLAYDVVALRFAAARTPDGVLAAHLAGAPDASRWTGRLLAHRMR